MKSFFTRLLKDDSGLTLPEYGIGLALAVGVGTVALGGLAGGITDAMTGAGVCMPNADGTAVTGAPCD